MRRIHAITRSASKTKKPKYHDFLKNCLAEKFTKDIRRMFRNLENSETMARKGVMKRET
uniref:Uncharacterized protein n=2 Tax=Octopus bimaculoides TaxID=37653 RepID=A0A0L8FRR0_OCTBM